MIRGTAVAYLSPVPHRGKKLAVNLVGLLMSVSILIVTVDTLRADHLSLYGGALPTPNIDAIGRDGGMLSRAYAPVGRTTQSVGTILTDTVSIAVVLGCLFLLGTAEVFADNASQTLLPLIVRRDDLAIATGVAPRPSPITPPPPAG